MYNLVQHLLRTETAWFLYKKTECGTNELHSRQKKLLGLVEGIKAFKGIVQGYKIIIHTDHLNLLYQKLPNQRMIRWRLLLEDFHPQVKHIALRKESIGGCTITTRNETQISWCHWLGTTARSIMIQQQWSKPQNGDVVEQLRLQTRVQQQMTLWIDGGNRKNRRILASQYLTYAMGSTKQQKVSQGSGNINATMSFLIYKKGNQQHQINPWKWVHWETETNFRLPPWPIAKLVHAWAADWGALRL